MTARAPEPAHSISLLRVSVRSFIGGCDLGGVIDWKWTNAGEILYGPSGG